MLDLVVQPVPVQEPEDETRFVEPEPQTSLSLQLSPQSYLRQPSLWLWQLDPEMLKEADMLEWLARRLHAGLPLPAEATLPTDATLRTKSTPVEPKQTATAQTRTRIV